MPAPMVAPATPGPLRTALELSTLLESGMEQNNGPMQVANQWQGHGPTLLSSHANHMGKQRPPMQTSKGSELHGTGECRPCAWFWKSVGCQNGSACQHCHLCPEGELRARKKAKAAARLAAEASTGTSFQAAPMMRMTRPLIVVGDPMPTPMRPSVTPYTAPQRWSEQPIAPMLTSEAHTDEAMPMMRMTTPSMVVGGQMCAPAMPSVEPLSAPMRWSDHSMNSMLSSDSYANEDRMEDFSTSMIDGLSDARPQQVALTPWPSGDYSTSGDAWQMEQPWTPMPFSRRVSTESFGSAMRRKLQNKKLSRNEFEDHLAKQITQPQDALE